MGKTAVELERESIQVTSSNDKPADKPEDKPAEEKTEETEEEQEEEQEETEEEQEEGEGEEGEEETEEAKAKAAETTDKDKRKQDRVQKRIDKLSAETKAAKEALRLATEKLAALEADNKDGLMTKDEMQVEAKKLADQEIAQRDFVNACNKLADDAAKIDKTFDTKIKAVAEEAGPIPSVMIGILNDLDNGGSILNHLASDIDEYERVISLPPTKMALELAKLSTKLTKQKPGPKPISKMPPPNERLGGKASRNDLVLRDDEPMSDWVAKRNAQVANAQKQKQEARRS